MSAVENQEINIGTLFSEICSVEVDKQNPSPPTPIQNIILQSGSLD